MQISSEKTYPIARALPKLFVFSSKKYKHAAKETATRQQ